MARGKRGGKRGVKRGGRKPGLRRYKAPRNVPEMASCSVTQWINVNTVANTMYSLRTIALSQFPRAVQVANAYQHYRIKKVTLEFKPSFDTFTPTSGAGVLQVPYLIYLIDKSGSVPTTVGSNDLGQMGARPIRFDDKTIKVAWRPSVLTETFGQANAQSQYRISPWLSTNGNALNPGGFVPSDIDHLGIFFKVDRPGVLPAGVAEYTYEVRITCEFQFKKPLVQATQTEPAYNITMPSVLDLSGNAVLQV